MEDCPFYIAVDAETLRILEELEAGTGKSPEKLLAGAVRMLGMVYATRSRPVVHVARSNPDQEMDG